MGRLAKTINEVVSKDTMDCGMALDMVEWKSRSYKASCKIKV